VPTDFDIIYPPKGRVKFSGGQNNKYDKQQIADNESPSMFNVVLGADSAETRGGSTKLNTTTVGSFVGDGLYTRNVNDGSTQSMVAWWNGTLYHLAGPATFTTVPSAQSIFTAGVRVAAASYENYLFFGNGTTPYKYNSHFTRHGVPVPSAPVAATAPTGTGLTGAYLYKMTNVNSALVEGDVSSASNSWTGANENARLTIATAPASHGVETRRLYRTVAGGSVYKRLATVSNNTATTYDDAIADGSLGTDAPTDQGQPPNYSVIVYTENRLFCNDTTNRNKVWYSELANPYVFKVTSSRNIGDNAGDIVRGLTVYENSVLVNCDNSLWLIYMPDSSDPTTWRDIRIKSNYGSINHFGTFLYNNKVMFPAVQANKIAGFAAVSGSMVDPSASLLTVGAVGSELKSNPIEPDIFDFEESQVEKISSFVFRNKAYIAVAKGTSQTTNNRIYVFDFSIGDLLKKQEGAWVPWSGINAAQFTEYAGKLYAQDSTATGFVRELNTTTYNDDGTAINSYFWTKEFSGGAGHELSHKDFRGVELLFEKSGDYFMTLRYRTDSDLGVGRSEQIDLNPGGSLWGTARLGVDSWGGGQSDGQEQITLGNVAGQRIQFQFNNQNTVNQKFKVKGLSFIYNIKNRRGRR
jgi:hypothetical protein